MFSVSHPVSQPARKRQDFFHVRAWRRLTSTTQRLLAVCPIIDLRPSKMKVKDQFKTLAIIKVQFVCLAIDSLLLVLQWLTYLTTSKVFLSTSNHHQVRKPYRSQTSSRRPEEKLSDGPFRLPFLFSQERQGLSWTMRIQQTYLPRSGPLKVSR